MHLKEKHNINVIKEIEQRSYPRFMWQYEEAESLEDIYKILNKSGEEGELFYHLDKDWYVLGVNRKDEILVSDFASTKKISFLEMNIVFDLIKKLGKKKIIADCRDLTSYNLLKLLEQRGTIKITSENPWLWGNEKMYEIVFSIQPKSFHEWLEYDESKTLFKN